MIIIFTIYFSRQNAGKNYFDVDVVEGIREMAIEIQSISKTKIKYLEMNGIMLICHQGQ
jgi:hypothetical protein